MKQELERLLSMKNELFIKTVFSRLQKLSLTEEQLRVLTDNNFANKVIKERYGYTYQIIKEVPMIGEVDEELCFVKGNRRYFSEKHYYNNRAYILCNDWYYPSEGKKNVKDTRTQFLNWVEMLESKENSR